jgi:hypothetical protein
MPENTVKSQKTAQWRFSVAPMMECEVYRQNTMIFIHLADGQRSDVV